VLLAHRIRLDVRHFHTSFIANTSNRTPFGWPYEVHVCSSCGLRQKLPVANCSPHTKRIRLSFLSEHEIFLFTAAVQTSFEAHTASYSVPDFFLEGNGAWPDFYHSPLYSVEVNNNNNNNDNNSNYYYCIYIYLLQLGCYPVSVVILHVYKT